MPHPSISSSINKIPPSNSSPKNVDPYKRASKGHSKVSAENSRISNRMSTQSNNS